MEPLVFGLSTEKEQGDSLALSMKAVETDSDIIIFNGVRFILKLKVLNPNKTILIADKNSGCSLADDCRASQRIESQNPGVPVMIYINSYAEAKAECDVCCRSQMQKKLLWKCLI